jgi:glycerol-3-phosphate acyltransferase PlsX
MKIGIDIMGGDNAPYEILKGVLLAQRSISNEEQRKDQFYLFGKESLIIEGFNQLKANINDFVIINCSEVIEMGDDPVKSFLEKVDSSIVKGFYYLQKKLIDGFASAGNTGAMLVGAAKIIGVIKGVIRPCISSYYPNTSGKNNLVLDVGINANAKPDVLYQYAVIGNLYAKTMMGIKNPKVGLLNIGSEEGKGNLNAKAAYQLMKNSTEFNFIGNIEGGDLNNSELVDVIVTDGFTGNIVLKHAESFYNTLKKQKISDTYFDNYNYENYGGTPILGINQTVVVGHGKSNDIAIKNMVLHTREMVNSQLSEQITKALDYVTN